MDRITTILRYEWRAFWRRFSRAGNLTAGNQGIALIFSSDSHQVSGAVTECVVRCCEGKHGSTSVALSSIFVAWLFPLASNVRASLATRTWLHLPLSLKERFIVRMVSLCQGRGPCRVRGHRPLLLVEFPACVQVVEIQDRVENQRIASSCLAAPHRII